MIVGTAGHIDHGKTTLVKALTGVDTDRLKEEKERGITLDLGYAYLPLPGGEVLGFIDVPGHEGLIHTMLAGATGIELALLVVAADDGVMPQTREHVEILRLLGVNRGAVALTKIDKVERERLAQVADQVSSLLAGTALAGCPRFPVNGVTGEGVAPLRAHLEESARARLRRSSGGYFRLAVDRCFNLAGVGTVVTGTVFSGRVAVGDTLMLSPAGISVRVRSLHAQNRPAEEGCAGERCALNLVGPRPEKNAVHRGDWLVAPALHWPTQRLDARVTLSAAQAKVLRHWTAVHFHLGAADITGRIALLEGETLEPGTSAVAQIVLERPVVALRGDRFILRDAAASRTLGGGVVLDPFAPTRRRRSPERRATLAYLERDDPAACLQGLLEQASEGVDLGRLALAFNLKPETASSAWAEVPMRRVATAEGEYGFSPAGWSQLQGYALEALAEFHRKFPDELGPDAGRLRRMAFPRFAPGAWAALIEDLVTEKRIARTGPWLHLPSHSVQLTVAERQLAQRLLPLLEEGAFDPPWVRELAATLKVQEAQVRGVLAKLARSGEAYPVVRDLFYSPSAIAKLARFVARLEARDGAVKAAKFRDEIGIGRKRAIQILEFFDRIGYTRRVGDSHRVRSDSLLNSFCNASQRKRYVPGGAAGLQTR